ncbi:MAG: tRNA (guanosine(46)-N7)-methyltransferase TrmB, partial [Spirochaetota bacterium]
MSKNGEKKAAPRPGTVRSFVVRRARMNELHRRAIERLSDEFVLELDDSRVNTGHSLFDRFPSGACRRRIFEIGFGMGYATARIAADWPQTCILGSEVYPPGVGKLLAEIERRGLTNVRIVRRDAVDVLNYGIREGELDGMHIFFPDPWPKKRHHKRRLIQPRFLDLAARRIAPGGYLYIATDWEDYAEHIAHVLEDCGMFENESPLERDPRFSEPADWRPRTAFERKGLAKGHVVREFRYIRKRIGTEETAGRADGGA